MPGKRHIVYFVLLALSLCGCHKDNPGTFPEKFDSQEEEWLYTLCSEEFKGRKAGTEGNLKACEYIISEIKKMGYEPETMSFEKNGITIRNIIVRIPGSSDKEIITGAHFDGAVLSYGNSHFPAADDNASGVVANLSFLNRISTDKPDCDHTILCCFWDCEEVTEGSAFNGSLYFTQNYKNLSKVLVYINLDTVGHDHGGVIRIYNNGGNTDDVVRLIAGNGRFNYILEDIREGGGVSDFMPFHYGHVPFIAFRDHGSTRCDMPIHSISDRPENISIDRITATAANVFDIINEGYGRTEK